MSVEGAELVRARHAHEHFQVHELLASVAEDQTTLPRRDSTRTDPRDNLDELVHPYPVSAQIICSKCLAIPLQNKHNNQRVRRDICTQVAL